MKMIEKMLHTVLFERPQSLVDAWAKKLAPHFSSTNESRQAVALCVSIFDEAVCTPNETPYSNGLLSLFKSAVSQNPPIYSGRDHMMFSFGDSDYMLTCGAGVCQLNQTPHPKPLVFTAGCNGPTREEEKENDVSPKIIYVYPDASEGDKLPERANDAVLSDERMNGADVYEDVLEIKTPQDKCLYLGESSCLSYSTALFCYSFSNQENNYKTVDCPKDQHCEGGKCVSDPDVTDPNCGPGGHAECHVTDEVDFDCSYAALETENRHNVNRMGTLPNNSYGDYCWNVYDEYSCGSDHALWLAGGMDCAMSSSSEVPDCNYDFTANKYYEYPDKSWIRASFSIDPPNVSSYFRLDIKHDHATFFEKSAHYNDNPACQHTCDVNDYDSSPKLEILFGDEQKKVVDGDGLGETCIYQPAATFTTAGIVNDQVVINFSNVGNSCAYLSNCVIADANEMFNMLALAKARIWSCLCVDGHP